MKILSFVSLALVLVSCGTNPASRVSKPNAGVTFGRKFVHAVSVTFLEEKKVVERKLQKSLFALIAEQKKDGIVSKIASENHPSQVASGFCFETTTTVQANELLAKIQKLKLSKPKIETLQVDLDCDFFFEKYLQSSL
jgi:hypothetical protein